MSLDFVLIDAFRIFFSLTFIIKLYYTLKSIEFTFRPSDKKLNFILIIILIILVLLFGLGILSNQIVIIIFILQRLIFRKILMYTLEDVYFHIATVFLLFVDTSNYFYLFETSNFNFQEKKNFNSVGIFLFTIGLAGTMLNASLAKFGEKIWHNGLAIKLFFNLPYRKRIKFPKIFRNTIFTTILGKIQIFAQMLLLPSIFFFPDSISLVIIFFNLVFCLSLVLFFHFLWLAELCLAQIILIFLFKIQGNEALNIYQIYLQYESNIFILFFLIISFIFIIFHPIFYYFIKSKNLIIKKAKIIFYLFNRFLFGLVPIRVFNSLHILNPIVFKIFLIKKNKKIEVFNMYKNDGTLNFKWMNIKPTFFSALTYKLTDILLEIQNGKLSDDRKRVLEGIIIYIIKNELKKNITQNYTFVVKIYQIDTSKLLNSKSRKINFYSVLKLSYINERIKIKKIRKKIFLLKTYRNVSRTNLKPSLDE